MNAFITLRGITTALGLVTAIAGTPALAAATAAQDETCYDFSGLEVGTAWLIEPQTALPIGIGTIRVHPLKLDGVVQTPDDARFEVIDTAIAGGQPPELAGTAVAIQMLPAEGVKRIRLRYSHQPGPDEGRAATVEVNGARRDWSGSFERLNHEHLGPAGHLVRFTVTPQPANAGSLWRGGQFVVESREAIRSFTIGAAVLRLDDVCFAR
jgi:hypothetical protein